MKRHKNNRGRIKFDFENSPVLDVTDNFDEERFDNTVRAIKKKLGWGR